MGKETNLVIETQSGPKRLMKLMHTNDGTVIVSFAPSPMFAVADSIDELIRTKADEFMPAKANSKISLHPSRSHATLSRINQDQDEVIFTEAIKRFGKFQFVQMRVISNLEGSRHDPNQKAKNAVTVGQVDTSKDTLVVGVVLGPKNTQFEQIESHPSNLQVFEFEDFNLWLITSLFNWPARQAGINFKYLGGTMTEPAAGLENWEIYNTYTFLKQIYSDAYFAAFGDSRPQAPVPNATHSD